MNKWINNWMAILPILIEGWEKDSFVFMCTKLDLTRSFIGQNIVFRNHQEIHKSGGMTEKQLHYMYIIAYIKLWFNMYMVDKLSFPGIHNLSHTYLEGALQPSTPRFGSNCLKIFFSQFQQLRVGFDDYLHDLKNIECLHVHSANCICF